MDKAMGTKAPVKPENAAAKDAQPKTGGKSVRTVSKDELERKLKTGSVQVVNVLEPEHYALGVIKGSKKIPLSALDKRFTELDKSKEVVTYCADITCSASRKAAELLAAKGFNVGAYEGGAKEWKSAGLPIES